MASAVIVSEWFARRLVSPTTGKACKSQAFVFLDPFDRLAFAEKSTKSRHLQDGFAAAESQQCVDLHPYQRRPNYPGHCPLRAFGMSCCMDMNEAF